VQVVALDVGTTRTRASLVNDKGKVLKSVSKPTGKLRHPFTGCMEVDPREVYANVSAVLKQIGKGLKSDDVFVSLSCMAPVLVLMGKSTKPLRPAILYNDLRTSVEVDEINERLGVDKLLQINGNRANIQQWTPKLLWLRKHESSTMDNARRLFDLSSYLVWRLTGEEIIDYSVALEGGLLDYQRRAWSNEMLSIVDLDSSLPELKPTNYSCELSAREQSKLGLSKRQVRISAGCVDAIITPLASGLLKEGGLSIELGTTGIIYTATRTPKPNSRIYLDYSPIDGLYYVGGATAASGIFYEWMVRTLMQGAVNYRKAEKLAATSTPGSRGVVILPYILGERTPVFDMFARTIIFGLGIETTSADVLRGAIEGVAYSLLHNLKVIREIGYPIGAGCITGGGAESPLFRKIISDVLGLQLAYNPSASTSLGVAYMGYMAAGIKKKWEDIQEWFQLRERTEPDASLTQIYDRLFSIYLGLYEKHIDDFKEVATIPLEKSTDAQSGSRQSKKDNWMQS
jgi:xylulokinase